MRANTASQQPSSYEDTFQLFADLPPPEPVLTPTEPEPPDQETTAPAEDPLLQLLRAHARTPPDIIATNLSPSLLYEDYDADLAEVIEQAVYKRYRDRGGLLRYRPSDMGDEAVYVNTDWPLWNPELDVSYNTDRERLSPTAERLTSHSYRDSVRHIYECADPTPTSIHALRAEWYQYYGYAPHDC
jgi:hypothetical protein